MSYCDSSVQPTINEGRWGEMCTKKHITQPENLGSGTLWRRFKRRSTGTDSHGSFARSGARHLAQENTSFLASVSVAVYSFSLPSHLHYLLASLDRVR